MPLVGRVAAKHDDGSIEIVFDRGGAELMAAIESRRRHAAAALYPRRHGRCARPRRLSDPVRQGRRLGRGTDCRPAFHARAAWRPSMAPASARPTSRCMSAPAPSSRSGSTTPTSTACMPNGARSRRRRPTPSPPPRRRRQHRHHRAAPARIGGARRTDARLGRRDRHLHHAGLSLPGRRPAADQLPSAALDPVHAGLRLRRDWSA